MISTELHLNIVHPATDREAAIYGTPDGKWRIMCHRGRSWSGSRGAHATTHWVAFSTTERDAEGHVVYVAESTTLKSLKKRLSRYLEDLEAG